VNLITTIPVDIQNILKCTKFNFES